eukprot:CCRYP_003253-RA/>CCRYP_003253-RA protein AED:0.45 eAED:0.50 QI:0/0/0/1/0/0/2/0/60
MYCKVFEDSSGALELARLPNSLHAPNTSMYAIITFESMKGLIKPFPMDTKDQIADTLTNA